MIDMNCKWVRAGRILTGRVRAGRVRAGRVRVHSNITINSSLQLTQPRLELTVGTLFFASHSAFYAKIDPTYNRILVKTDFFGGWQVRLCPLVLRIQDFFGWEPHDRDPNVKAHGIITPSESHNFGLLCGGCVHVWINDVIYQISNIQFS